MTSQAWLESLSEDWVSQPGSDGSLPHLTAPSSPPVSYSPKSENSRERASRIPRLNGPNAGTRRSQHRHYHSSPNVLFERNANDINIRATPSGPSRIAQETKSSPPPRRYLRRSTSSNSTAGSVIHKSALENKPRGASQAINRENEPEWRRRLLYGELEYGESKDLFSSAATGLENIFRPPRMPVTDYAGRSGNEGYTTNETTLPSSPPPYLGDRRDIAADDEGHDGDDDTSDNFSERGNDDYPIQRGANFARQVSFRRTDDDGADYFSNKPTLTYQRNVDDSETQLDPIPESSVLSFSRRQLLEESRKISGQSDIRNEDFSPIFIARRSSEDGAVSFSPMELPAHQLRKKLEILQRNKMIVDPEPENSTGETMDADHKVGNFANPDEWVQGGSIDASFFRRPLSPSINMDFSDMLPESSLQASTPKQFPTARTSRVESRVDSWGGRDMSISPSPSLPRAPHPSPDKRPRPVPVKTSSPLKLFGPYDTFTNQTLLRRISQFEDQQSNKSVSYAADKTTRSPKSAAYSGSKHHREASRSFTPLSRTQSQSGNGDRENFGAMNRFGGGELDAYEFDGDISLAFSLPAQSEKENESPTVDPVPLEDSSKFDIHEDTLSEGESLIVRRHRVGNSVASGRRLRAKSLDELHSGITTGPDGTSFLPSSMARRNGSEAKRPRTSPSKDPTPKRRRTLHRSDIAYGIEDRRAAIEFARLTQYNMQSMVSRDRKHTRQSETQKFANLKHLQMRNMIRPRSPTPKQRASGSRDRHVLAEVGSRPNSKSRQSSGSRENSGLAGVNDSRKASMKTQDFFDAAEEVMAMIRNKARPITRLASVEEFDAESSVRHNHFPHSDTEQSYEEESTEEPFSRPPSREGQPIHRLPTRQENPDIIDQLKKYEERGDLVDMMSQSIGSMGAFQDMHQSSRGINSTYQYGYIPNQTPRVSNIKPNYAVMGRQYSGNSTDQSVPTTSSKGSDSRRLIAPDVVAQLIGNQVGNMVFDGVTKMWQKVKSPRPPVSIFLAEDSEDDPFASIPDLTVDSATEIKHLGLATHKCQSNDTSLDLSWSEGGKTFEESTSSERVARDNCQAEVETALEDDEEIDHELSLHEERIHNATPTQRKNLTISFSSPVASIIQDNPHRQSGSSTSETDSSFGYAAFGNTPVDSIKRGRHGPTTKSTGGMKTTSSAQSRPRVASGNFSMERSSFIPRPISRIDEQDENTYGDQQDQTESSVQMDSKIVASAAEQTRHPDLSVIMATPNPARNGALLPTPMLGQYVGTFSLSPMSEFTIHQVDHSCALEVSYIVGDRYVVTGDGSKKTLSKSLRSLVEKITEVEPFEPDWESVPELDLSNKQLDTLHMLDEFCTSLVTLDASKNAVSHVDGVPPSVRNLRMTHNVLSELTSWGQLLNLQYVDISNNQIKSLSAFKDLVHLRSIRADNNQITSLNGIKFHDSLQVLRVRGNLISHVDFDGTKMQRLTELDLEDNQIVEFENADQLSSLSTLNLQRNNLTSFTPSRDQSVLPLRFLKISNNDLNTLDLTTLPSLRLLHADRNNIGTITGFSHCRHLDSLSLREQKGDGVLETSFLDSACEVRKLFLSGNRLSCFKPGVDFLNLQYLELANCGLQSLASNIGQQMPNLRMLNINFNAIDDLWPLRYIPRLKKLLAAGNRLSDARKVAVALAEFPHLSRLDLRNNSATLGFYAPVQTLVPTEDERGVEFDPFVLPDIDVENQQKFASRLDMGTRMRKRIYDIIVLNDCKQLKMLDGMPVSKAVLSAKDDVWKALVKSGILEEDKEQKDGTSK